MLEDTNLLYSRADEVVETEVNGVVLLLHLGNWNYFEFNPISSAIWSLLEKPASLDTIVTGLEQQFDVGREQCLHDTRKFLDDLVADGIVTRA
ncbi:MAG: PqqD family protein [Rhizomicrobium sp.]